MKIIIGLIILCTVIMLILNKLYMRTNYYRNSILQVDKFIKGVPKDLEIVNTGSSYARFALDYDYTKLKGFNFGLQPQSLSYDFRILKQYKDNLKEGCKVLIVLPDFVFSFLDYKTEIHNIKYYYFLKENYILNFSKLKRSIYTNLPLLSSLNPKIIILKTLKIFKDSKKNKEFDFEENKLKKEKVKLAAKNRVCGWKKEFNLPQNLNEEISEELVLTFNKTTKLLQEIIEYCLGNNWKPILVVPPCSSELNELLPKNLIKKVLYDNIEKANKRNIPLLSYLYDEKFQDSSLYIDSDRLNKKGREKFTKKVIEDMEEKGI
ncbi:MAG: hypothetical protein Q7K47_08655 [Fusobacterium sp. JB019]|nr:hypothetical protein [Fusobacterium sp. JB019]